MNIFNNKLTCFFGVSSTVEEYGFYHHDSVRRYLLNYDFKPGC